MNPDTQTIIVLSMGATAILFTFIVSISIMWTILSIDRKKTDVIESNWKQWKKQQEELKKFTS